MTATMRDGSFLIGLIGQGVAPSFTPELHEREGLRHGFRYVYRALDLPECRAGAHELGRLINAARELGFNGLNLTHPVKRLAMRFVDSTDVAVDAIGAINTLTFDRGIVTGYNTDRSGFAAAMADELDDVQLGYVALIGAGGAGSAVAHALADRGAKKLVIIDTNTDTAAKLAEQLRRTGLTHVDVAGPAELPGHLARADGVVNATPMGMAAHPGTAFNTSLLNPQFWVADVVYRPVETPLLASARLAGCRVMSGLRMAMHQAADAFEIFTGERADRRKMASDLDEMVITEAGLATGDEQHEKDEKDE